MLALCIGLATSACHLRATMDSNNSGTEAATVVLKETESTDATTAAQEIIDVPETTAETQSDEWKTAYLEYLESARDWHVAFALVYVDDDAIPELYLNGDCEATGDTVCTYKDGVVIAQQLGRTLGGSYIPGSGMVINTNGNMGYYYTDIYAITNGSFTCIWSGLETNEFIHPEKEDEEATIVYAYFIDEQPVSEAAYYAAIEAVFNTAQAVPLHENAVSYDAVCQQILNS